LTCQTIKRGFSGKWSIFGPDMWLGFKISTNPCSRLW